MAQFIGAAPYERTAQRRDQRAGHRSRTLGTTAGQIDDLPVPRTRGGFRTQLFDRYQRRMAEVDNLMRDMFVGGVSQQAVGTVVEHMIGTTPSPSTVSRVFHTLEAEFETWQKRTLPCRYAYVFADDTYFSVIYDGEGQKMPILALIGITVAGQREVIACNVGERDRTEISNRTTPALYQAQDGQPPQPRARKAARDSSAGAARDLLSKEPGAGRPGRDCISE